MVDANAIIKNLWIGAAPPFDRNISNVDALVLCAREIQPATTAFQGRLVRSPLPDDQLTQRELSVAIVAAAEVAQIVSAGKRALVTCVQGRNRSALVTGIALGRLTSLSADGIVDLIRKRRRMDCLTNKHFVEYLKRIVGPGRRLGRPPAR